MLLKELREKRGLSQKQLSAKSGISQNYISEVENEKHEASEYVIIRLCIGLGVDPNTLLGWQEIVNGIKEKF